MTAAKKKTATATAAREPVKARRNRENPEVRRKSLIEATRRSIAKNGFAGTTIEKMLNDADTSVANAILNPDEFLSPFRMPQKFDKLRVSVGGFVRTYTIDAAPAPILAADSLPLLLAQVRAN